MCRFCRIVFILFSLLSHTEGAKAQYYISGQDAASVKWCKLKTNHFDIIYPENFEKKAQFVANYLEDIRSLLIHSLEGDPPRIPLVLHNETIVSNAFVGWAPKRMEFYTCPPQDSYAQDWLEQLCLHEYRHVVHYHKMSDGLGKILSLFFGEQLKPAMLGTFIPFWFIEGDAVFMETALSDAGRGRLPSFEAPIKTQVNEQGLYSYDKASLGSYKDYIPDRYILGYHLVSYARGKYGAKLWEKAVKNTARNPWQITPFSHGIKKATGQTKKQLYQVLMEDLDSIWKKQTKGQQLTPFEKIPREIKQYTNYSQSQILDTNKLVCIKSSLEDIKQIVQIDKNGEESVISTPGRMYDDLISAACGKVCWTEVIFDPRWEHRNYSVIKIWDGSSGKTRQISKKSRYFAPALSADAKKIACISIDQQNQFSLVLLDSKKGETIRTLPVEFQLFTPVWMPDQIHIAAIALSDNGKALVTINSINGNIKFLTKFSFSNISEPRTYRNYIFFNGSYSGIETIYAYDTTIKEVFRVVSSKYGAKDAIVSDDGQFLYYSDYHENGYRIVRSRLIPRHWDALDNISDNSTALFKASLDDENGKAPGNILPTHKKYSSAKYRKWQHLFNFHSWAPVSINTGSRDVLPGFSIFSQNTLSTSFTSLGYEYNPSDDEGNWYAEYSYHGWYPVVESRFEYGKRSSTYQNQQGETSAFDYYENRIRTSLSLPLDLTNGVYFTGIRPKIQFSYIFLKMAEKYPVFFIQSVYKTIDYQLYAYRLRKQSHRDLYSKWGQVVELNFRNDPFSGPVTGKITAGETNIYFPGFFNHHGFKIYAGFQKKEKGVYNFPDYVNYPRGYVNETNDKLHSFAADYFFPIAYPDISFGSIVYLKRMKGRLFCDYAEAEANITQEADRYIVLTRKYHSYGAEIRFDFHLFRFLAPIDAGLRMIHLPAENTQMMEFLFSIDFNSI